MSLRLPGRESPPRRGSIIDTRFRRAWRGIEEERRSGRPLPEVIARRDDKDLVAALAGAGKGSAVEANAIATELLNRLGRRPYLGAAIASATSFLLIHLLDFAYTGTPLVLDSGARANTLGIISFLSALAAILCGLLWRGRLRRLHALLWRAGRG